MALHGITVENADLSVSVVGHPCFIWKKLYETRSTIQRAHCNSAVKSWQTNKHVHHGIGDLNDQSYPEHRDHDFRRVYQFYAEKWLFHIEAAIYKKPNLDTSWPDSGLYLRSLTHNEQRGYSQKYNYCSKCAFRY